MLLIQHSDRHRHKTPAVPNSFAFHIKTIIDPGFWHKEENNGKVIQTYV